MHFLENQLYQCTIHKRILHSLILKKNPHKTIKNYENHILNYTTIKPEIALCIYLVSGECIGIIKTFWIKILQRKWKKIFNFNNQIIKARRTINNLKYKEIHGKWKQGLQVTHSLNGMYYLNI